MASNIDDLAEKRGLRLRIGRMRRRIDRRLRAIEREGRLVVSWRTWVRRFSGQAVLAAAGAGLAASAAVRLERWIRAIGLHLARHMRGRVLTAVLAEFRNLWRASAPKKDQEAEPASGGADRD